MRQHSQPTELGEGACRPLSRALAFISVLAIAGCGLLQVLPAINLASYPQTVYATNPFLVGEQYTLGSTVGASTSLRAGDSLTITSVDVLTTHGVRVLGLGARQLELSANGIGLVPGWPPADFDVDRFDRDIFATPWIGPVQVLVGVETLEEKSGLRGLRIGWSTGQGVHYELVDLAVLTCSPGACANPDDNEGLLKELGLLVQ